MAGADGRVDRRVLTHSEGFLPSLNSIVAAAAVFFAYVVRFGVVAEGGTPGILLQVTTDFLIPTLSALWLLLVPAYALLWSR